jgi:hypothetical protein
MYNFNYAPTTLRVQSWRENISEGTRKKEVEHHWCRLLSPWYILSMETVDPAAESVISWSNQEGCSRNFSFSVQYPFLGHNVHSLQQSDALKERAGPNRGSCASMGGVETTPRQSRDLIMIYREQSRNVEIRNVGVHEYRNYLPLEFYFVGPRDK